MDRRSRIGTAADGQGGDSNNEGAKRAGAERPEGL